MYRLSLLLVFVLLLVPEALTFTLRQDFKYSVAGSNGFCDGSLGRCNLGSELLADSEVNRRILASTSTYISYGALTADRVPCSTAGRSYYNCRGSGAVNPYTRGCSQITKCQRDTS